MTPNPIPLMLVTLASLVGAVACIANVHHARNRISPEPAAKGLFYVFGAAYFAGVVILSCVAILKGLYVNNWSHWVLGWFTVCAAAKAVTRALRNDAVYQQRRAAAVDGSRIIPFGAK